MARVLKATPMELYLKALQDYGTFRFIAICPEDLAKEKECHRIVIEQGNTFVNGYKFLVLQIWDGSHNYNTQEFSILLDGVIQDAKDLGVEFISKADRDLVLASWEQDKLRI